MLSKEQGGNDSWDIATGIGITAIAVAAGRAAETTREGALIQDPYARLLVERTGVQIPLPLTYAELEQPGYEYARGLTVYMAIRTRVFDDFFAAAVRAGVQQAVILASGLDARAYRLEWPEDLTVYEIDQPQVLDYKLSTLDEAGAAPRCAHTPVPVDLRDDWGAALEAAGFDPEKPTAWLAEGLMPYLPVEAEDRLLAEIHRLSAPGSRLAVEEIPGLAAVMDDPTLQNIDIGVDLPTLFDSTTRDLVETRLQPRGWKCTSSTAREFATRNGRTHELGEALEGPMGDASKHTLCELP